MMLKYLSQPSHAHEIEELFMKISMWQKAICRFYPIFIKIPIFTEIEKLILKFIWKHKITNAQSNPNKKEHAGDNTITDFKLYCKAIVTSAWYWHKSKHEDQWIGIEHTKISPYSCSYLSFDKDTKNIHWRKHSLYNIWSWENWISTCWRLKQDISHPVQKWHDKIIPWMREGRE
jgi:hypothetical protein